MACIWIIENYSKKTPPKPRYTPENHLLEDDNPAGFEKKE